jgi:hypothetical protein
MLAQSARICRLKEARLYFYLVKFTDPTDKPPLPRLFGAAIIKPNRRVDLEAMAPLMFFKGG